MELTDQQQLLVDALKAYLPGNVYSEAEKKTVFRGFKLYNDRAVDDIAWNGDQGLLVANLVVGQTGKTYPVNVSLEGHKLGFRCLCNSHDEPEKCEHIICTLATLVHLLKPNLFKIGREDRRREDRLLAGLMKTPWIMNVEPVVEGDAFFLRANQKERGGLAGGVKTRKRPNFRIIVEESGKALRAHVERDGERIEPSQQEKLLKPELLYLMSLFKQDDLSLPQPVFLKKWVTDYPIIYRDGTDDRPVTWMENASCATWMEFDVSGKEVVLRKRCGMGENLMPAELIGGFAFNREQAKICLSKIETSRGWKLWRMIRAACLRESLDIGRIKEAEGGIIRVPKEIFRNFQIMVNPSVGQDLETPSIVYKVEGFDVNPLVLQASSYRLAIAERA